MRLWWRQQERNQVRHLLNRDGGFQSFWHQREAGARNRHDVAAEYRFGHAFGALEREARGAFVGDDPVERAAIACLDGVADEVRRDLAIRVEDVEQHLLGVPLADGGEVRTNVLSQVPGAMTRGTGGFENR